MNENNTSAVIDGIKALLDAHLTNIRGELARLSGHIESVDKIAQRLERDTNVMIAEIRKDITSHDLRIKTSEDEIKAIKSRIEINEDVQLEKWTKQDGINQGAKNRDDNLTKLLLGALSTFIALVIATIWNYFVGK